jgi:PAS domain S-box-containing protein
MALLRTLRARLLALFVSAKGDANPQPRSEAAWFPDQGRAAGYRIAIGYAIVAGLWSFSIDRIFLAASGVPESRLNLHVLDGLAIVAVTSLVLYFFVRYAFTRIGVAVAGLERSEARYRALFDETFDAIFVARPDSGAILDANPRAADLTGWPVESLRGMRLAELYPPEEAQAAMMEFEAMSRSRGERRVEQNVRRSDGGEVPVEISAAVGELPGGERLLFGIFRDMSERRRAEQTQQESERRYRVLFDSNPHPMWVYDLESLSFLAVNDAAVRHYGYPPEEFLGMTVADILPPEEGSRLLSNVGAARRRRGPDETGAWRHLRKDGGEILVEISSHTLDWEGRPAAVVLAYDVTEARKAGAALRESELRLRLALRSAKQGMFDLNVATGNVHVSDEYAAMLGYDPARFHPTLADLRNSMHPEDRDRVIEVYDSAASGGISEFRGEFRVRAADGQWKWILVLGAVVDRDAQGRALRMLGTHTDISESKAIAEQLRRSRDYYLTLLEDFPALIWRSGLDGKCDYFNKTWLAFTGRAMDQELGDGWTEGLHPEDRESCVTTYSDHFTRRESFEMEYRVRHAGGEYHWVRDVARPFSDLDGRFAGFLGSCFDITERKQMELSLRESELRLRLALRAGKQGLYDVNVATGEVLVNDEYARMLGYDPARFHPTLASWREALHPEDRDRVLALYDACISGDIPDSRAEFRLRMADGRWKWILAVGAVVERDRHGRALRMVGTHTDISEDKAAEERILKLSRLYATLSHANQAIVRARSEADLLREVCRVAVDHGNFRMASFGIVEGHNVKIVATQGDATGYLDRIRLSVDPEVAEGRGPTGTALRLGRPYVCDDFLSDPATLPWHEAARAAGFRSTAAVPVTRDGKTSGVITFYATEPGYFDPEIVSLIEALAANLSHGLDALNNARERESAMERLRAANDRLTAVFEASPLSFVILKPDGVVTDWNPAAQRVFGWTAAEAIGRTLPFVPPERAGESAELRRRAAMGESIAGVELRRRRKDGAEIEVSLYTAPLHDSQGEVYAIMAILADITERKRLEAELRRVAAEREQLDLVFNRSPAIAFTVRTAPGLPIEFVSRNVDQYGYSAEELMGGQGNFASVVHPDDLELAMAETAGFIAQGHSEYSHEYRMLTRGGEPRWTDVRGWIERDGGGQPVRITGVLLDITARKLAEQELARTKSELQQLSIRLLEVQEKERQALSRELHDELGQALTAVKLHLQRIMRQSNASGFAERLEECVRITDGALQQVRGLSLWLRPPQLDDLGLEAALRWQVLHMAEAGGLEVRFAADPDMPRLSPEIEVACFRVAQEAMTNVVRHANARHLDVELRRREGELEVRVRDDGCGFDEPALRRGPARASVGLVGMHERVALVHGSLEIHSRPGAGTEVVANFPVRLRDESAASRRIE